MTTTTSKLSLDMRTTLFRFECSCGRRGAWLERRDIADKNGRTHEQHEHAAQQEAA